MQRIRTIKPEFFLSSDVVDLTPWARLLFIGLWTCADRDGRLEDDAGVLKRQLFPDQPVDVDRLLGELAAQGVIQRYEGDGQSLIAIPNFQKHQRVGNREPPSKLPPPPTSPLKHTSARFSGLQQTREEREREREEEGNRDPSPTSRASSVDLRVRSARARARPQDGHETSPPERVGDVLARCRP
jgi:hypothetical protein